jgi:hypothetical protein
LKPRGFGVHTEFFWPWHLRPDHNILFETSE